MSAFTVTDYALGLTEIADREDLEKAFFHVAKFYLENSETLDQDLRLPSGDLIAKIIKTVAVDV